MAATNFTMAPPIRAWTAPAFALTNYFQDDKTTLNTGLAGPVEFLIGNDIDDLSNSQDLVIAGGPSQSILSNWIGFIGEIIIFDRSLNQAEELILENYLSVTFGIPSSRRIYIHGAAYNYHLAGIGRVNGSSEHKDSKGQAMVRISNPSDLDDNEFLFWAHDNEKVTSGGANENIWRVHHFGNVGTVDVQMYAAGYNFVNGNEFSLFIDNNINFNNPTEINATQWDPGLEILTFENVTFGLNDYFTFGASVVSGPPVIDDCPLDITSTNDPGDCGASVGWVPPISDGTLTSTHNPGEVFPVGTTTVTYTATNVEGTTTCSFTVTVTDDEDPLLTNCPTNISVAADAGCNQLVNWTPPTASDNCNVTLSSSHNPGDNFTLGTTTVTYTATDDSGNSVSCSFDVTVNDTTDTQISNCSPTITISDFQPSTQDAVATWTVPTASDNCKVMTFDASHNPGTRFPVGTTQVTYTAQDDAGNSTSCSFEVVVNAVNSAPLIESVNLTVNAGETERICLNTSDPDDHNVVLNSVSSAGVLGAISNIDTDALCFDYTAPEEFEGDELVEVTVCDDGDPSQCVNSTIEIKVEIVWELSISQVVTPNGDGINDTWFIGNIDKYPINRVLIFDRWGSRVYKTDNYNNNTVCWNGNRASDRARDQSAPSGTYFYQIELSDGRSFKGFIELVGK